MKLTTAKQIWENHEAYLDREIDLGGWVRPNRDPKSFGFLTISDGSFSKPLQVIYYDSLSDFQTIRKINVGAVLIIRGILVATPDTKQPFEIQVSEISVEGDSTPDYPLQKKRHSPEFLRTILHLHPRTNLFQTAFRMRSVIALAIHRFFQERNFVYVHTPLIASNDAKGAGEVFRVTTFNPNDIPRTPDGLVDYRADFFSKEINLTVSGQLDREAFAQTFRDIYTFGPTFRAENSNTTRYAVEFWMVEPGISFADLNDAMALTKNMSKYIIRYVLKHTPEEMEFLNRFVDTGLLERLNRVLNSEFGRIGYTEAADILMQHNDSFDYKVSWGIDLQTEHERFLTEQVFKRSLFITDYPKDIKAFCMKLNPDDKTVAATDCLVSGIGEIIGDSQCEDDYDKLLVRIQELHIDEESYCFYLDLRKYGSSRHAGYGLGFGRCVMYLTGIQNIRDVLPFPRTVGNCEL